MTYLIKINDNSIQAHSIVNLLNGFYFYKCMIYK